MAGALGEQNFRRVSCSRAACGPTIAPSMILLGSAAPTVVIAAAAIPAGASISLASVLWETTLQQHVPNASLSRVSAYDWLGSTALRPIGYALAGTVGANVGLGPALIASAVLMVVIMLASLARPSIRNLRAQALTL
jgi:hypothetical protein